MISSTSGPCCGETVRPEHHRPAARQAEAVDERRASHPSRKLAPAPPGDIERTATSAICAWVSAKLSGTPRSSTGRPCRLRKSTAPRVVYIPDMTIRIHAESFLGEPLICRNAACEVGDGGTGLLLRQPRHEAVRSFGTSRRTSWSAQRSSETTRCGAARPPKWWTQSEAPQEKRATQRQKLILIPAIASLPLPPKV